MLKLMIIADDLTGALDTGIQFAKKGILTRIFAEIPKEFPSNTAAEVFVVNAETRHLPPQEAARTVVEITRRAVAFGVDLLFKKTDSALRGNVAAELLGMLDASGQEELLFFPAHPTMGRTTRAGVQYIDGVPAAESVFGQDPFEPVVVSEVRKLFDRYLDCKIVLVPIGEPVAAKSAEEQTAQAQKRVLVFDAESEDDLRNGLASAKTTGGLKAMAGCAGIAAVLPEFIGLCEGRPTKPLKKESLFVVCGSLNPITLAQLDKAEADGFKRVHLTDRQKLEERYLDTQEGKDFIESLGEMGKGFSPVIIDTLTPGSAGGPHDLWSREKELGLSSEEARRLVADRLGEIVCRWLALETNPGNGYTIAMTGGDILAGFMRAMGANSLTPVSEVSPGAVLSHLDYGGSTLQVVSKSGGFGGENVWSDILKSIQAGG